MTRSTVDYKSIRMLALAICVFVFFAHYLLPDKRTTLYPKDHALNRLYGYSDPQIGKTAQWVNEATNTWECNFLPEHSYGCGYDYSWHNPHYEGINIAPYDAIELDILYEGVGPHLRLYTRGFNSQYSDVNQPENNKHMFVIFHVDELTSGPIRIDLTELRVSKWWLIERNIHRQWASPELDNITSLGIDIIEHGYHKLTIKNITLVGRWVNTPNLLFTIIVFWMLVFLLEGLFKFFLTLRAHSISRQEEFELLEKQKHLELEKIQLKRLADQDPLTLIHNRSGFLSQANDMLMSAAPSRTFGLMIMDLDHFKSINDTYGHDIGDLVLKTFANTHKMAMRSCDLLARWGGEEFVLLCEIKATKDLPALSERIRKRTEDITIDSHPKIRATISIGTTFYQPPKTGLGRKGEAVDAQADLIQEINNAIKRADNALYRAKRSGRNRVEHED